MATDLHEYLMTNLIAAMKSLESTIPSNTEIVLHDLSKPKESVVFIVNGSVSGRRLGDPLLSGPDDDIGFLELFSERRAPFSHKILSGYTTKTDKGKELNSASTLYYDSEGKVSIGFCINVDTNILLQTMHMFEKLLPAKYGNTPTLNDVEKLTEQSVKEYLARHQKKDSETNKTFRNRVIQDLYVSGFFKMKSSVSMIAHELGVTRYTVYNYIEKIKKINQ
ncbi:helix-turn-helix transcriptional regulator [Enterobacter roggenkampii]|uniref:helix-turn-helix transcriptional regulator n=1 Tax=Enterobacter roggenkampii TaxID=1812935 RepID=UPI002DBA1FE3|nr:PAS domain-containing protein [Enterobacter roggenkampii]MEB5887479.1 helix-turn-helix transcriptional regulator [Enterobacter roggenkampii]